MAGGHADELLSVCFQKPLLYEDACHSSVCSRSHEVGLVLLDERDHGPRLGLKDHAPQCVELATRDRMDHHPNRVLLEVPRRRCGTFFVNDVDKAPLLAQQAGQY